MRGGWVRRDPAPELLEDITRATEARRGAPERVRARRAGRHGRGGAAAGELGGDEARGCNALAGCGRCGGGNPDDSAGDGYIPAEYGETFATAGGRARKGCCSRGVGGSRKALGVGGRSGGELCGWKRCGYERHGVRVGKPPRDTAQHDWAGIRQLARRWRSSSQRVRASESRGRRNAFSGSPWEPPMGAYGAPRTCVTRARRVPSGAGVGDAAAEGQARPCSCPWLRWWRW